MALRHKLGLKKRTYRPRLHLAKYINRSTIKLPTTVALNMKYVLAITGMLANGPDPLNPPQIPDGVGDCVWAASLRLAAARANSTGRPMDLTQPWAVASALEAYSACTGFSLDDPTDTDQGTDPDQAWAYLQATGIRLADGTFDKTGPPVEVDPTDFEMVLIAHNLFGGLYCGINFPADWEDAPIWDVTSSQIEGGHEIPTLSDAGISPEGIAIDTWGTIRIMTPAGMAQQCNQLTAMVDPIFFRRGGKAINGFDAAQLAADLALV
jgi:hypothetical protein